MIKSIIAIGICCCLADNFARGCIEQTDAYPANAHLPCILLTILVFIEPNSVANPVSIRANHLFTHLTSARDVWDRTREISVENIQKTSCSFADVKFIHPRCKTGTCLGPGA